MFCHPTWAASSNRNVPPSARSARTKNERLLPSRIVTLHICEEENNMISYPTLNIRGKKRIRKGQMVEFSIVSVEGGKFKANEVNLV